MTVTNEDHLYQIIGGKIKKIRIAAGVKQADLASKINLSRTSIVNIEQGRQHASLYLLWRIGACLNVQLSDLLPLDTEGSEGNDSSHGVSSLGLEKETIRQVSEFMDVANAKHSKS